MMGRSTCRLSPLKDSDLTDRERVRLERLLRQKTGPHESGCMIWVGGVKSSNESYGCLWFRGRSERAHRVFVALCSGRLPLKKAIVRHLCGNSSCVNPAHLCCGSISENNHDTYDHGHRMTPVHVTEEDVQRVLQLRQAGWSTRKIAKETFLPRSTVRDVLKKKSEQLSEENQHAV